MRDFPRSWDVIGKAPRSASHERGTGFAHGGAAVHGVANQFMRSAKLVTGDFQTGTANAGIAHAEFLLYQLDQLHEFGHGVQAKERKKPAIKFKSFASFSGDAEVKEVNGFARKRVGKTCDPADGSGGDSF